MALSKIQKKQEEIKHLDAATQAIIKRLNKNDQRLRLSALVAIGLLLAVGVLGIYRQNQIANANKNHIDCIVKLLSTPSATGQTRRIINLESCQIKVS